MVNIHDTYYYIYIQYCVAAWWGTYTKIHARIVVTSINISKTID